MTVDRRGNKNDGVCGIIITYNPGHDIAKILEAATLELDGLIVIDNMSDEHELTSLKSTIDLLNSAPGKIGCKVLLILNTENVGLAKAYNLGIHIAVEHEYGFVLFLDPDSYLQNGVKSLLLDRYRTLSKHFGKFILCCNNVESLKLMGDGLLTGYYRRKHLFREGDIREVLMAINSGLFVNVGTFQKIGFFDERYFIDSVDHEFTLRLLKEGYRIFRVDSAIIIHNLGETLSISAFGIHFGARIHSSIRSYYIFRDTPKTIARYISRFPTLFFITLWCNGECNQYL